MRVLVDGRVIQDRYDGIGRHAFELVTALASLEGPDPPLDVVVLRGSGKDDRLSVRDLAELPAVTVEGFQQPVVSATEQLRWPSLLERLRPDVVFAPYHLAAPLLSTVPVVPVIHDCIFESDRRFAPGRVMRAAYIAATWAVLHRVQEIVTVSQATRDSVQRRYRVRIAPTNVVPNGVDLSRSFERGPGLVATSRAALDLPERYLLHVGVRRPHKNQETLVRAFARLSRTEPDLHLVLVGKRDERFHDPVPGLVGRLHLADRVRVIPSVPEDLLPGVFAGAAVFAFPSFVEGFGMPLLEAMAVGTPVVAARTPAVAEVAGEAAILVPPADADGFAEAIARTLHDEGLRSRLRERGRGRVDRFRWTDSAAALALVLRRAAGERTQAPSRLPASDGSHDGGAVELTGARRSKRHRS
jgi:glycosyltransferase involved in cell wall biosynthesis